MPCSDNCARAFFVYYRSGVCWAIFILAAAQAWSTYFRLTPSTSIAGIYASSDCSGPNLLQVRLLMPAGLNFDPALRSTCHYSNFCSPSPAQNSLNLTFVNASFLTLQAFSGANCSGNSTYSAALALPAAAAATAGGPAGCLVHTGGLGSSLYLPNYNDPEGSSSPTSPAMEAFSLAVQVISTRLASILFLMLLYSMARGAHVKMEDAYKVVQEPWEAARAASASPVHLAAALLLFVAAQAFYVADYAQGSFAADGCVLAPAYFPYFFYWPSFAAELAALLALITHVQLWRLARDAYCFGGSAGYALFVTLYVAGVREPSFSPVQRPHRSPLTASTLTTALLLALISLLAAAITLVPALAPHLAPLHSPTGKIAMLVGMAAVALGAACLCSGCWASRGVSGVGCQRGLRVAHLSEPPRYATPQALSSAEIFSPERLWAALRRRGLFWTAPWQVGVGGGGGGGGGGAGGGGAAAGYPGGPAAPAELYLLHLGPSETQARLASCLECWKAKRQCPGGGAVEGGQHNLQHTCGICLESTRADRVWMALVCHHLYHSQCILQWVRVAHGNRTGLPACPLDQLSITRRIREESNSWSVAAISEANGRFWVEHTGGGGGAGAGGAAASGAGAVLETYYSSGSRRMRVLPAGAIVMTPVVFEEEGEEEEEGGVGVEGDNDSEAEGQPGAAGEAVAPAPLPGAASTEEGEPGAVVVVVAAAAAPPAQNPHAAGAPART